MRLMLLLPLLLLLLRGRQLRRRLRLCEHPRHLRFGVAGRRCTTLQVWLKHRLLRLRRNVEGRERRDAGQRSR